MIRNHSASIRVPQKMEAYRFPSLVQTEWNGRKRRVRVPGSSPGGCDAASCRRTHAARRLGRSACSGLQSAPGKEHEGCPQSAICTTGHCKAHGGGRQCQHEGCPKSARGTAGHCVAHGGGRRCEHEGCPQSAIGTKGSRFRASVHPQISVDVELRIPLLQRTRVPRGWCS